MPSARRIVLPVGVVMFAALACGARPGETPASPKSAPQPGKGAPTIYSGESLPMPYPVFPKADTSDDYFGTKVNDPYRALENDPRSSAEVADWIQGENKTTSYVLSQIPQRKQIKDRLTRLWNYERYSAPSKEGKYYIFSKNDGLQPQSVVYVQDSLNSAPRVLVDPNTWSKDGTVALSGLDFTLDGSLLAYGVATAGSDWVEWKVKNVGSGDDLPDHLKWTKFTAAAWTRDNKGFYYGRYAEPPAGEVMQQVNKFQKLYYHQLGDDQAKDVLVYERADQPDWEFAPGVTEDGHYLIISISKGTDPNNQVLYRDLTKPGSPVVGLIENFDSGYGFIANDGPVFYFQTQLDAPNRRVIAIDTTKPEKANWREVIPQAKDALESTSCVNNQFVCNYLHDASTRVSIFDMGGKHVRDVEFPELGTAGGFGGLRNDTETFYSFTSFLRPPATFRYDLKTGKSELLKQAKVDFDPSEYETRQVFYASKDGTKVPMFVTARRGLKLDGTNPTLLYGYGGFDIPITPSFSASRVAWLEMGGVYAVANIRGGGEYGEAWHKAGTTTHKQNVFDDFIAAAEYLVQEKYTSPSKLAIQGGSNGGLLIGACLTQRPDLFAVAQPQVGVMDMLRYHKFTIGWAWADDYGKSSDSAEMFKYLYSYSPYHNIHAGTRYPATLITTADHDDRVVPGHSFKFAAALQEAQAPNGPPVLIRIETKAGHGAGKSTEKIIEEASDVMAFMVKYLNMNVPPTQ